MFCVYQIQTNVSRFHILSEPVEDTYQEAGFEEGEFDDDEEGVS